MGSNVVMVFVVDCAMHNVRWLIDGFRRPQNFNWGMVVNVSADNGRDMMCNVRVCLLPSRMLCIMENVVDICRTKILQRRAVLRGCKLSLTT